MRSSRRLAGGHTAKRLHFQPGSNQEGAQERAHNEKKAYILYTCGSQPDEALNELMRPTDIVGKQAPPCKDSATTSSPKNRKRQGESDRRRTGVPLSCVPCSGFKTNLCSCLGFGLASVDFDFLYRVARLKFVAVGRPVALNRTVRLAFSVASIYDDRFDLLPLSMFWSLEYLGLGQICFDHVPVAQDEHSISVVACSF